MVSPIIPRLTRHSWILLQEALFSLMFWSYAPLFAVIATAAVLVVKIRIEVRHLFLQLGDLYSWIFV